jgi:hypothetical protein
MKKWQKITLVSTGVLLMMGTLFAGSFAWFQDLNAANMNNGEGQTASAYFAGGDGSAASPYLIDKPVHLYNLAWLQYLGFFNKTTDGTAAGTLDQKHFALSADLDMTGWVLPPIGTTLYPFVGTFTGANTGTSGNYVISNLTIDNQLGAGHITRAPETVKAAGIADVNIVGTFGVVGNYDGMYATAANTDGKAIYSSSTNYLTDFYIDKATINTQLKKTLIGIAAGYVNAPVTGVGVSHSATNVSSGSSYFSSALTSNLSDYTTIGYCTANYKAKHDVSSATIQDGKKGSYYFSSLNSGQNVGSGGSIGMNSIFTRLKTFYDDTSSASSDIDTSTIVTAETKNIVNGTATTTTTGTLGTAGHFKNYYDSNAPKKGSYSFDYFAQGEKTQNASGNLDQFEFICLYGYHKWNKTVTTNTTTTYGSTYSICYSGRAFLAPSGTTAITNSSSASYSWTFSAFSGTGTISTKVNNTTYYLVANGTSGTQISLKLSTTASTTWTKTDGVHTTTSIGGTTYYLEYYNDWHIYNRQHRRASLTYELPSTTTTATATSVSAETNDTYFPINVDTVNLPSLTNTGYIVGGANYNLSTYYRCGDVRVSSFQMGNLAYSLNGDFTNWSDNSATFSSANFDVLTSRDTTPGDSTTRTTYCIKDGPNDGGNYAAHTVNSNIQSYYNSRVLYTDSPLEFKKYKNSRASLTKILTPSSGVSSANDPIYGLHFMDSSISTSNLVEVPVCVVNRDGVTSDTTMEDNTYYKYQMPRDSIDFNLQKKGYINFFAGTYFPGNNTFFSLHKIERSITTDPTTKVHSSSTITSIKQISKIYANPNDTTADYQYVYFANDLRTADEATTISAGYQCIFDMKWLTDPVNLIENAAYYFEIPVNPGEYALGSVAGDGTTSGAKYGAYLMYLDISANAQPVTRTVITEYIQLSNKKYEYPLGIAVVNDPTSGKETIDALKSVAVSLKSNLYSGTFTISKDGNNVTFTTDNVNFSPGYKGDDLILLGKKTDGTSFSPPSVSDISADATSSYIKRMTYIDRNLVEDITTVTVITYDSTTSAISVTQTIITKGVAAAATTPTQFANNSGDLTDTSTLSESSIDVSSLPSTASYWYSYFSAQTSVTTTYAFTYAFTPGTTDDGQAGQIASITGYTITMTSTGETLTIHVDLLLNTYTVVLDGTTVATGPIPTA